VRSTACFIPAIRCAILRQPARQADRPRRGSRQRDRRLDRALGELTIEGLATTKALHQALARDADVQAGALSYRVARAMARIKRCKSCRGRGRADHSNDRKRIRPVSNRRPVTDANPIFLRRR